MTKKKEIYDNLKSKTKNFSHKVGERIKTIRRTSTPSAIYAPRLYTHWILWGTFLFFFVFLFWAYFAKLEEVTVATGTIIPLTHVQSIENMEGGIIKSINVHENDIVDKGQVLAYLDPTRFDSGLGEAKARSASLQLKILRLNAEIQNQPYVTPDNLRTAFPDLARSEEELYRSRQQQLQSMQSNYVLAQKELQMTQPIVKEGAASEVDVLHLQRQVLALKTQIDDFKSHALDDLDAARGDYNTLTQSTIALQDRADRTVLRSPVKGIVKEIRLPTSGGVVQPGQEIMTIIPLDKSLLVEAQVKPSQIGFVHINEPATVKITAYDYSIYGGLEGTVKEISADTIKDQQGHNFYLVRIKTNVNYLGTPQNPLYIIPGMTASVNILTGKRTVLNYLLMPLVNARENALRER